MLREYSFSQLMEDNIDTLLQAFCDITGANLEEGRMYLEMSGSDLNRAVSLYYDNAAPQANDTVNNAPPSSEDEYEMEEDGREEANIGRIYNSQGRYDE